jgi:hypothetical protein
MFSQILFQCFRCFQHTAKAKFNYGAARLKNSWTHIITPSPNFVEVRCGAVRCGAKYLPWQAMHFLQHSTHFSKTWCGPLITSKFLASEFPFHCWKSPEIAWAGRDLDCMADVLKGFHRSTFPKPNTEFNSDLAPCDFWAFPTVKRELRGKKFRSDQRSAARFWEVGGAL